MVYGMKLINKEINRNYYFCIIDSKKLVISYKTFSRFKIVPPKDFHSLIFKYIKNLAHLKYNIFNLIIKFYLIWRIKKRSKQ